LREAHDKAMVSMCNLSCSADEVIE
jgi:hypothetical protein